MNQEESFRGWQIKWILAPKPKLTQVILSYLPQKYFASFLRIGYASFKAAQRNFGNFYLNRLPICSFAQSLSFSSPVFAVMSIFIEAVSSFLYVWHNAVNIT